MDYNDYGQSLCNIFPTSFRSTYPDISPQGFLEVFQEYVRIIEDLKHILTNKQLEKIKEKEHTVRQYQFIFYHEYGSLLFLNRQKSYMPINIGILYFNKLNSNAFTSDGQNYEYVQEPQDAGYYQIKQFFDGGEIIQTWAKRLNKKVNEVISQLTKDQRLEKSPFYFKKIVEYAINKIFQPKPSLVAPQTGLLFGTQTGLSFGTQNQPPQAGLFSRPQNQSIEKPEVDIPIQNNGTINFNHIFFPDVYTQFCYLIYSTILGDKKLAKTLLLSFKIDNLTGNINSQEKEDIQSYKACLNYLIVKFKSVYNQQIQCNKEAAFEYFNQISGKIESLYAQQDNKQYKMSSHELCQSLKTQKQFEVPQTIEKVKMYSIIAPTKLTNANSIGFALTLYDSSENCFTKLNELLNKVYYNQCEQYYWVAMVQRLFFELSENIENLWVDISQVKITQRDTISQMHTVVNKYQQIMTNTQKSRLYSYNLKNQAYSHVYLIKYLAAAFAFQLFKRQIKSYNIIFQVNKYTIQLNLRNLYTNFTSMDYKARKAIQNLSIYIDKNKSKSILFSLDNNSNSNFQLKNLAKVLCEHWKDDRAYLINKQNAIEDQIKQLQIQFTQFKSTYNKKNNQLSQVLRKSCSCKIQPPKHPFYSSQKIQCNRCKQKNRIQSQISLLQAQKFKQISASLPQYLDDQYLRVYFEKIKQAHGGILNLIYDAQIPIVQKVQFSQSKNTLSSIKHLYPYSQQQNIRSHNYYSCVIQSPRKASEFVAYRKPITIYYYNYCSSTNIDQKLLQVEANPTYNVLQWMIQKPSNQKTREHKLYANLDKKYACKLNEIAALTMQQYKIYGTLRVCHRTQLIILAQAILSRNAAPITHKLHQFQRLIIMNTCGSLSSFKPSSIDFIQAKTNSKDLIFEEQPLIVIESIEHLLQEYLNYWKFQDIYSLQIIGPVICLFSKILNSRAIVGIVLRAYEEYQKVKQQNSHKRTNQTRLRELYLLHSIICCFSEDICQDNTEACRIFGKIMVNYRINKFLLKMEKYKNNIYVSNIKKYEKYFDNSVLKNILPVIRYFSNNLNQITQIVRQIDEGITKNSKWQFNKAQNYTFKSQNQHNKYEVNFFEGIVLKNGAQTSQLPQVIKNNPNYIQLFGQNSDVQVYQEKNGAIRTRSDYSHHFEQEKNTKVFFQFCTTVEGVKIRMIFQRQDKIKSFILIPHQVLKKQIIYIPKLYLQLFQCWMDQQEIHLIFRKRTLKQINKIGLVILNNIGTLDQAEGRIITKQFQKQPLDYLISKQYSHYFQKLFIIDKEHVANKAIEVLSAIEHPDYILQTYASGDNKQIVFWLHRCGLKFIYDSTNKKLLSENYQGYSIPDEYHHHELLPWKKTDDIRCLIIRKHQKSLRTANLHQYLLLLPNQNINRSGKIRIIQGEAIPNQIFSYEIHDNFMDIRSKARINQLHLICLIASLHSEIKFKPLMMKNEEYCINLIRCCYSNQYLDQFQCGKMSNLMNLCIGLNLNTLILCCDVLRQLSNTLTDTLAFNKSQKQAQIFDKLTNYFNKKNKLIKACKLIYRLRYERRQISFRGKLNDTQIMVLGINKAKLQQFDIMQKQTKWDLNQCFGPKLEQKSIKGLYTVGENYHKMQKDLEHLKETLMQFFQKENFEDEPQKQLKIIFGSRDILSKQMIQDLEFSYAAFLRYNQKYEKLQLTKEDSIKRLTSYFTMPKQKCQKYKKQLARFLEKINDKGSDHLDFILGSKQVLTINSYTEILCDPSSLQQIYPKISKQHHQILIKAIKQWILLTLQIESLSRILIILSQKPIDKIALFRQLQSPRKKINQKMYWICFQAEMKIRIWLSQYDTYHHLRQSQSGSVSQLNMGEGKTQVIIPMIVLDNLYDDTYKHPISRINILSSLFKQAEANYFRFFSVTSFRIPIFSWHFNRKVQVNQENINKLKFMIYLLKKKMILLMDRESCLSMTLKIRQECLKKDAYIDNIGDHRDEWVFENNQLYDIYDEVDALMTSKKSFVYSVGASQDLPDARVRFEFARIILQVISVQLIQWFIDQKIAIIEETYQRTLDCTIKGGYPRGLRLKENLTRKSILILREKLVRTLFQNPSYSLSQLKFYQNLNEKQRQVLLRYLVDQSYDDIKSIRDDLPQDKKPILALRGLIAFGILEHCLIMRNGVDFGVPGIQHPKRLGVPYQAGDLPSKRSQFSHPDVSIIVSMISYFVKGIDLSQFTVALHHLLKMSDSAKIYNYRLWYDIILDEKFKPTDISEFKQINIDSSAQIEYLYEKYRFNRNLIAFWLIHAIFPKDLKQYKQSITSSCYDIAYTNKSIGFSGTKDTRWLFPSYIRWEPTQNDAINGTDGKMIHLMVNHTLGILSINEGKECLWERFCQQVLALQDEEVGCIIDAGAILVGKSFQKEIVPWIVKNPLFKKHKFRGITFCDQNGKWKVFDTVTLSVVQRGTSIPQHETFVIFDEARTRGSDIKMGTHVKAVLSLSPNMTKDKLMQAVGRLRKFGRHQQIYIMTTPEILGKIKGLEVKDLKQKTRKVINWTCENSLHDNRHTLFANSRLGQIHFKTVLQGKPDVQKFDSSLDALYSGKITEKSVYYIYMISINSKFEESMLKTQQIEALTQKVKLYGSDHHIKNYQFDDVCQRQVQFLFQTQKIIINEYDQLVPQAEDNRIEIHQGLVSSLDFKFSEKLQFSKNFINCTTTKFFGGYLSNQLSNINFFLWQNGNLKIITQRQMCLQLQKGTPSLGYYQLKSRDNFELRFVGLLSDLTMDSTFVRMNNLQEAITHALFFNGKEFFDKTGRQILSNLIKIFIKDRRQSKNNVFLHQAPFDIQQVVSHFLVRRRTYLSKFLKSDLQKVTKEIKNLPEKWLKDIGSLIQKFL